MNKKKLKKQKELRLYRKRWRKELRRRQIRKISRDQEGIGGSYTYARKLDRNVKRRKEKLITVEDDFSICNNTTYSINLLNTIIRSLKECVPTYIDISNVNNITADALVYLLAIIDKMKYLKIPIDIRGNLPKDQPARNIFVESGFLNYVRSNAPTISTTEDCVQIYDGRDADSKLARNLCQFTMRKFKKDRMYTKDLYNIIMEIIINTKQHAYRKNTKLPKWYAYARYDSKGINFSILDTGLGIPSPKISVDFLRTRFPLPF